MTLQQLKYAVTAAECGTISAAAEKLSSSQPSLTTAIRELEAEMGVTIFSRTNRGVVVSREGEEFLGYARQLLSQAQLMQELHGFSPDVGVGSSPQVDSISIPLAPAQFHTIGYILRRDMAPSSMTLNYIEQLRQAAKV